VNGFSGGAYYSTNLAIIYSETIAGGMAIAGGPYGAGFRCSGELLSGTPQDCDSTWTAEMVEEIKEMADKGEIDPVSNLVDMPFYIIGGDLDTAQDPLLQ